MTDHVLNSVLSFCICTQGYTFIVVGVHQIKRVELAVINSDPVATARQERAEPASSGPRVKRAACWRPAGEAADPISRPAI